MSSVKLTTTGGNGGTVELKGPANTTSNAAVQLTLPVDDGTANQYLKTDGSGALSWAAVGGATGTDYNDNVQARFGTGNDLIIYHDGSNSHIKNGTGSLTIDTENNHLIVESNSGTMAKFLDELAVELYHDGTKQCETSANGLAFPSGKGIDFSAQTSSSATGASATGEVLDHYEYGTWTPVVKLGTTVNSGTVSGAVYTRIGDLVIAQCTITSISASGTGNLYVYGQPFTRTQGDPTGSVRWAGISSDGRIWPYIDGTVVSFQNGGSSGYTGSITNSHATGSPYHLYSLQLIYHCS